MKIKRILLILLSVFILFSLTSSVMAEDVSSEIIGDTIEVDGSAYNQMNNPSIQDAIDSAQAGDVINITGKTYTHCHFVVNKQLTIISEVGTKMDPCSGNMAGSGGLGIFYFTENASGSILSGFTFENYYDRASRHTADPYSVYVNGADNITITDCKITATTYGAGIYLNSSDNSIITDCDIEKSKKGVFVENSKNTMIKNSLIDSNTDAGIYIGEKVENSFVNNCTITGNNYYGVYYASCVNSTLSSNVIANNRNDKLQARASLGTGIYVDCPIDDLKIVGNYISENGNYGIFNAPDSYASVLEHEEYIDCNFFYNHKTRAIFSSRNGDTGIIYIESNFFSTEQLCPSTFYEEGYLRDGSRDLIFGNITRDAENIYTVTVVKRATGEVATPLSNIDITFFLNKKSTKGIAEAGDQYVTVKLQNGSATANFENFTYKTKNNTILAISSGSGIIRFDGRAERFVSSYKLPDSEIPENQTANEAVIISKDLEKYYGETVRFEITLEDDSGSPLANETVTINVNGVDYVKFTDANGQTSIPTSLNSGKYTVTTTFKGNDDIEGTSITNTLNIISTVGGSDIKKMYRNGTQFHAVFTDINGNPLANGTFVRFNINGVFYNRTTDENGSAQLNINLNPGVYVITSINPNSTENAANTVTVLSNIVENRNITKYYRNSTQYTFKVLGDDGKALANANVSLNINGVFYYRTTDENGSAQMNINLQPGTYIITADYKGCKVSNTIEVLPILYAKDLNKTYGSEDTFNVTLLDGQGNPNPDQTVVFNINGVFYNRTTDDDGIARLNIRLMAGEYIITSTYNEVNIANKVTITG